MNAYIISHPTDLAATAADFTNSCCTLSLSSGAGNFRPGQLLEEVALQTAAEQLQTLRHCRISKIELEESGIRLTLTTDDPASKAVLWTLAHALLLPSQEQPSVLPKEPEIPFRGHYTREKWEQRLAWLREHSGQDLEELGDIRINPEILRGNIENFVGSLELPVGLAGPLFLKGKHTQGYCFAPFATTEGALVASACRGAKALNKAGGVTVQVLGQQMMRGPVFICDTAQDARLLEVWLREHEVQLHEQVAQSSRHARLTKLEYIPIGRMLHLRFMYETGDAAGQNMTTVTTWKACQWVVAQLQHYPAIRVEKFMVESNMSGDKKVNFYNYISGRGTRVMAEAFLPEEVLREVLKVEADELVLAVQSFMAGSLQMGMMGFNINVSNVIAAIFAATGQDIACVHESSVGQLSIQRVAGGVHASLLLPSLIIGTVGGGTGLPTQRNCLELMDCYGPGKVQKLAEIIAGYSLALDLSTLCAIVSGQFASAHERLGRNRPEDGLQERHLNEAFFRQLLAQSRNEPELELLKAEPLPLDTSSSILSSLTGNNMRKKVGHFPFRLHWKTAAEAGTTDVVVKAKPTDREVVNMLNAMAQGCGNELAALYDLHRFRTGFRHCHLRELKVNALTDPRFTDIAPKAYHTWRQDEQEIFVLVTEYLQEVTHLNTVDQPEQWQEEHICAALRGIARFHSLYLGRTHELQSPEWQDYPTAAGMQELTPLWQALLQHNRLEFPELYTTQRAELLEQIIRDIPRIWQVLDEAPHTLVHNDFNLRNICLRPTPQGPQLCAYDWELATIHVPQHDVAEFLAFVLPPDAAVADWHRYLHYYRTQLEHFSGRTFPPAAFTRVFDAACFDLAYNRLGLYSMAHTFNEYSFLPRVVNRLFGYVEQVFKEWKAGKGEGGGLFAADFAVVNEAHAHQPAESTILL